MRRGGRSPNHGTVRALDPDDARRRPGRAAAAVVFSLSIRISLATLPQPMRGDLGRGIRMLPLGNSSGGKILLATSLHEVFAYNPRSNRADRVFSLEDLVDAPGEGGLLLNMALHEESVTSVRHRRPAAGDRGTLKMHQNGCQQAGRRCSRPAPKRLQCHTAADPADARRGHGPIHNIINMYND